MKRMGAIATAMTGCKWNNASIGLLSPNSAFCVRTCDSVHLAPESADAVSARQKPNRWKSVILNTEKVCSVKVVITQTIPNKNKPKAMREITIIRLFLHFSSPKPRAKARMKRTEVDLIIVYKETVM